MVKEGILIVNKPKGMTSHDVVDYVRKKLKIKRVGHTGTLDPLATGVLIILIGKYTKLFSQFLKYDKAYEATLVLGIKTDTGDITGKVIETRPVGEINIEKIKKVFLNYLGVYLQVPHQISALKYKGERLYKLSRKGKKISLQPRKINIYELRLLDFNPPKIKFYVRCSSGTYIRRLAEEIAQDLGTVGCILEIERKSVGPFRIEEAFLLSQIQESHIISQVPF